MPDGFWRFTPDLELIYSKCAHLLILTDVNRKFAPYYRKKHCIGEQNILEIMELISNAHNIHTTGPIVCKNVQQKRPHYGRCITVKF